MLDFLGGRRPVAPGGRGLYVIRISFMHTDTIAIIVAILGVGLALWRAIASIRQDVTELRQEVRADIAALNSRIAALYQALFSHKDPAA